MRSDSGGRVGSREHVECLSHRSRSDSTERLLLLRQSPTKGTKGACAKRLEAGQRAALLERKGECPTTASLLGTPFHETIATPRPPSRARSLYVSRHGGLLSQSCSRLANLCKATLTHGRVLHDRVTTAKGNSQAVSTRGNGHEGQQSQTAITRGSERPFKWRGCAQRCFATSVVATESFPSFLSLPFPCGFRWARNPHPLRSPSGQRPKVDAGTDLAGLRLPTARKPAQARPCHPPKPGHATRVAQTTIRV